MKEADLIKARAEAALARERLLGSAHQLQERLKPGTLANNAWEQVKDGGETAAQKASLAAARHPIAVSTAAAGLAALIIRKPLLRLLRRNREPAPRVQQNKRINGDER